MLVLALDTTTKAGSVALVDGGRVLESRSGDASRPHAQRLPADLLELLARHNRSVADVGLFAVAAGPGSFTGLRIGIATMQGLALAADRPLVGVAALDALAAAAAADVPGHADPIAAWMDAQRGEVFSAVYMAQRDADGRLSLTTLDPPVAEEPDAIAGRWQQEGRFARMLAAGDGASRYRETIRPLLGGVVARVLDTPLLLAPAVGELAVEQHARGGVFRPHAIAPIYVRRSDAEIARERRGGAQ